jgi:ADP-L-glycero-D-manno-heptose 6-epimerase
MFVVTGANGFIGSVMVWELNQRGITDILVVDRIDPSVRPEILKRLKFSSYMDADEFLNAVQEQKFSNKFKAVFHMGACSSTTETNEAYLKKVNTDYSKSLFLAARAGQWPLLYASSGAVYGGGEMGFDDQLPSSCFKPLNLYGWSKANVDVWSEQQSEKPRRWYGLRFFNVYGPNEYHKNDMSSVIYKAVQQIQQTGRLKLFRSHRPEYKNGEQRRDFVYVKDITNWMWQIYQNPNVPNGIYNMGYGESRTWLDLARAVFKNMGRDMNIDWIDIPESIRNQYQYLTEAKMQKLFAAGLSTPQWPIEKGITDYLQNYLLKDDPYLRG